MKPFVMLMVMVVVMVVVMGIMFINQARRRAAGLALRLALVGCLALPAQMLQAQDVLRPFARPTLKAIEAEHASRPFWLVLWDLECTYCMVSMKNLADAQANNPALQVVTIATTSIEEHQELSARLRSTGLRGPAYAFGSDSAEALRYAIDPKWRGEKPRAYYYGGDGQRRTFSGVVPVERFLQP